MIDGSPKGVYASLSALQTAYPSGSSGVYLTSDNGHWYYWNGSAWTDGGIYHSSEDVKQIKEDLDLLENEIYNTFANGEVNEELSSTTEKFIECELNTNETYKISIDFKNVNLRTGNVNFRIYSCSAKSSIYIVDTIGSYTASTGDKIDIKYKPTANCKYLRLYIYAIGGTQNIEVNVSKMFLNLDNTIAEIQEINNTLLNSSNKEINWQDGYRITRTVPYPLSANGYSIAEINMQKGDLVVMQSQSAMFSDIIQFTQVVRCGDKNYYVPLNEKSSSNVHYFIAPYDMTVIICKRNAENPTVNWYSSDVYSKVLDISNHNNMYDSNNILPLLTALSGNPSQGATIYQKPITLLHFSDVHNALINIVRIKDFSNLYANYINDVICTGDMCGQKFSDYSGIFNEEGYKHMLLTIGNHDVYDKNGDAVSNGAPSYDDKNYWATNVDKYNQYFKSNISNWNVTQPANAENNGYCYYYKDYDQTSGSSSTTISKLRLIVLDTMAYDEEQHNWLSSVLQDAKTNNYAVVIAQHFPPMENPNDFNEFNTAFSSFTTGMESYYGVAYLAYKDSLNILHKATDLVDEFINDNGEFVCWLCGHLHYAKVGTLVSHPNQIYIAIETANYQGKIWKDISRSEYDKTIDLFNIVSFDTYNKIIKVARIGAEYDYYMRHRGTMTINYATRTLISSN